MTNNKALEKNKTLKTTVKIQKIKHVGNRQNQEHYFVRKVRESGGLQYDIQVQVFRNS